MIFKLYDCDIGIKVDGVNYDIEHVASVTIDDPERNNITRGNNAKNKTGLVYKEGLSEPKRATIPIMQLSIAFKELLDSCFDEQRRCDFYCISRKDGSSKFLKNAILANRPQQLSLDDSAESMQVSMEFVSFDSSETHKS